MELKAVRVDGSSTGRVRVTGQVSYDDRPGRVEECWFEFPGQQADSLCLSGSPWLVCLLPLATTLGEPLRIDLPVDRLLYRNVHEVLAIWKAWFPRLRSTEVIAECGEEGPPGRRTAAFFSGGVDSFFTVMHNNASDPAAFPADELICVGGFDIPLRNLEAFSRHRANMERVAERLGKPLVDVVTNLRQTRMEAVGWLEMLFSPALIAVGLMLGARYRTLLIAAGHSYTFDEHCGGHPLTDPLLSTSRTRVVHDGARFDRFEKVEFLSRSEIALQALHVCWSEAADSNCGACEKCVRTMLELEIVGSLDKCTAFPRRSLDFLMSRLHLDRPGLEIFYQSARVQAIARGRPDIAKAIDGCLRRSRMRRPFVTFARSLRGRRFLWRFGRPLRHLLLKNAIQR